MKPMRPMQPGINPNMPKMPGVPNAPGAPNMAGNPATQGGIPLTKVPIIPWDAFVAGGLQVHKDEKIQPAVFDPQPMESWDEVVSVYRLLLSAQSQGLQAIAAGMGKRPNRPLGVVAWDTVPEEVQRHFRFRDKEDAPNGGGAIVAP